MHRLNSEGHDESQYLPKGIPPINPFRAQHGNLQWEGEAIKDVSWLPEKLYVIEKITKPHLDSASSFQRALIMAERTLGISDIRGALFDKHADGQNSDTDMFLEFVRKLAKPEISTLTWFVFDKYNHGNINLALHLIGTIQHGLENVQKVIQGIKK
jgi:hypothetical protein